MPWSKSVTRLVTCLDARDFDLLSPVRVVNSLMCPFLNQPEHLSENDARWFL